MLRRLLPLLVLWALAGIPYLSTVLERPDLLSFGTRIAAWGLAAMALDFVLGMGGIVALGHAGFVGIGAYVTLVAMASGVTEFLVLLPLAAASAAAYGLATGAIALRGGRLNVMLVTFVFGAVLAEAALGLPALGGMRGLAMAERPMLAGLPLLGGEVAMFWTAFVVLLVAFAALAFIRQSPVGRALAAVGENAGRAESLGIQPFRHRLQAYAVSAGLCGIAGALIATVDMTAAPSLMTWQRSAELLVIAVLGAPLPLAGAVAGTAAYFGLKETLIGT
ncbi:MAG TPA: branched-chain amino acid ABC transporter permease, partial [Aestuariivirgaceae bacterium]|nr:branched-chain amino acid ABC transporter permease [Aestuariivirgaceae bacterium]